MKMSRYAPGLLMGLGFSLLSNISQAQAAADSTGLPGDNFSLQGALTLFKQAASPEAFEQSLNTESNKVNNLDLNEDGKTDYIRVINKQENDIQIFVLQALVSDKESQDIAVIELQKNGQDEAVLQIVGDEDIFGEETIVEPAGEDEAMVDARPSLLAKGPNMETAGEAGMAVIVNVWSWPCVRFVYAPAYRVWVSPWSWAVRPGWYRPWRPLAWTVYRPIRYHFRPHYAVVHTRRVVYAPRLYRPMRVTSVTVTTRHHTAVTHYRTTKASRTVVTTPGGRRYQAARKTTSVEGPRGNKVSRTKTTVRRKR